MVQNVDRDLFNRNHDVFVPNDGAQVVAPDTFDFHHLAQSADVMMKNLTVAEIDAGVVRYPRRNGRQEDVGRLGLMRLNVDRAETLGLEIVHIKIQAGIPPAVGARIWSELDAEVILIEPTNDLVAVGTAMNEGDAEEVPVFHFSPVNRRGSRAA